MQGSFKRIRAGLDGHKSAPSDDTGQPPPHGNQGLESTTDAQSDCELDIFHLVTGLTVGDEESPACLKQMEEGGKGYKAEEHIQLTRGERRYSWDIPPDERGQNDEHIQLTRGGRRYSWDIPPDERGQNDNFGQESMGGRKFSWHKPPNLTDFNVGLMNLEYMGGKSYRWDSYRAPSLKEFVNMEV